MPSLRRRMEREQALSVAVTEVVFQSEDGRFSVVKATDERSEQPLTLVGELGGLSPGETLAVRGRFEQHATYGKRFRVESFTPVTPATREGIKRYLGSGLVDGIGPALAERLVERFGERTLEVITTQSARLREVSGIGPKKAGAIAEAVRARAAEAETLAYLHGLGLGPSLSKRLRRQYGTDTVRVLREDPYLMAEEVAGIGFRTADRIGRALGYGADDPRRAAGAALHLVGQAADQGHVFVRMAELIAAAEPLDVSAPVLEAAVGELCARGLLIEDEGAIYAPPFYRAEVSAAKRLQALAGARRPPAGLDRAIEAVSAASLSDDQRRAVAASFEHGLFVLTGGPGTGKTTTVRTLVAAQRKLGRSVLLCAPTGRAAKRLSETTGAPAQTIHRLLEYNPKLGSFQRNADQPLEADVVLVDEASMLDLRLGDSLLAALPKRCSLVLVGDVDQLPPVGAGPLLRELIESGICPVVRLSQVFRQAQRSAIVRAAHDILQGKRPTPTPPGERGDGDLFVIRAQDPELIAQRLLDTLERMRAAYQLDPKRDVQVLSPMRKGPLGTERLNELLQSVLNPAADDRGTPGRLRRGDKVMQLRNDYDREVFNGDLGEVRDVLPTGVVVDMSGRRVAYDREALESIALAYASTIHKVQGSEFPAIVVVLHATQFILLSRALIYTAVTRAKRLAVIIGEDRALARAVSHNPERRTNSRLCERLRATSPAPR